MIEYVTRQLVDKPDQVRVEETNGEKNILFELHVDDDDMGKIFSHNGRSANSSRTILAVTSAKQEKRSVLEIVETYGRKKNSPYNKSDKAIVVREPFI